MKMSSNGEIGKSSVQMMQKLLPILLYIRNYNEYKRHQPLVSSSNSKTNYSKDSGLKIMRVSQQINAYYEVTVYLLFPSLTFPSLPYSFDSLLSYYFEYMSNNYRYIPYIRVSGYQSLK